MVLTNMVYGFVSPGGTKAKLSIFIFHRVLPEPDPILPWEPDRLQFDSIVGFISSAFNVFTLSDAIHKLVEGTLPAATAVITFDDGYADNYSEAREILLKHSVPATFFIAAGFLDGGRMWNDDVIEAVRRVGDGMFDLSEHNLGIHKLSDAGSRVSCYGQILRELKYRPHDVRQDIARRVARCSGLTDSSPLMMTTAELIALSQSGMEIGAHTMTHPILSCLTDDDAEEEIRAGRCRLEDLLGRRVEVFAYPNGAPGVDYDERHVAMVKRAGFVAAVSTRAGVSRHDSDLLQLARFTPWDRDVGRFALRTFVHLWRN